MLSVKEIMTRDVITVSPETDIAHAARLLLEKSVNGVPVVDATGTLVGILCQSDLVAQQKKFPIPTMFTLLDGFIPLTSMKHLEKEVRKITATTVADAMSPNPVTVRPDASIEEVGTIMVDRNFHTVPVVDKGDLVGIVGKEDVLRTLVSGL
ncbi:MAG: CBS domain-containing protein [Proteobacteria bacterium]|nr:CBS domain-containing protein [Pseudomonadota bacterium]